MLTSIYPHGFHFGTDRGFGVAGSGYGTPYDPAPPVNYPEPEPMPEGYHPEPGSVPTNMLPDTWLYLVNQDIAKRQAEALAAGLDPSIVDQMNADLYPETEYIDEEGNRRSTRTVRTEQDRVAADAELGARIQALKEAPPAFPKVRPTPNPTFQAALQLAQLAETFAPQRTMNRQATYDPFQGREFLPEVVDLMSQLFGRRLRTTRSQNRLPEYNDPYKLLGGM